ncbi:hypothetical protein UlMin_036581 [Ulmus minor]
MNQFFSYIGTMMFVFVWEKRALITMGVSKVMKRNFNLILRIFSDLRLISNFCYFFKYQWKTNDIDIIYTITLICAQMIAMLAMREHRCKTVPIIVHKECEQAEAWSQIFNEETTKQSIPVIVAWELNERMYENLQGFNKEKTAKRYGKEITHGWRKSYDIPPPNGESLEMCAKRTVVYFKNKYIHIEPDLQSGKHVMVFAHANSMRSIITSPDNLTSQEVSNGVPLLYIYKDRKLFRRGSHVGPTEAGTTTVLYANHYDFNETTTVLYANHNGFKQDNYGSKKL